MNDFEYLIYPEHSDDKKIAFGVRSVALNANVCVRTNNLDAKKILTLLEKMKNDLQKAHDNGELIADTGKYHLCSVILGNSYCEICGEIYR